MHFKCAYSLITVYSFLVTGIFTSGWSRSKQHFTTGM